MTRLQSEPVRRTCRPQARRCSRPPLLPQPPPRASSAPFEPLASRTSAPWLVSPLLLPRSAEIAPHGCRPEGRRGKTAFARSLLSHLRYDLGLAVAAYDGDGSVGLGQVFGTKAEDGTIAENQDPANACAFYDIRSDRERDLLLNTWITAPKSSSTISPEDPSRR